METMWFAALPPGEREGRTMSRRGKSGQNQPSQKPSALEPADFKNQVEQQSHEAQKQLQYIEVKSLQQEFQAKKVVEQATSRPKTRRPGSSARGDKRKTKCNRKRKSCVESNGKHDDQRSGKSLEKREGLGKVINFALSSKWVEAARMKLKEKVYSNSTLATKQSKRKRITEIMQNCNITIKENGISADELLTLAAVLGEANIKSADQYLAEVKLLQLEMGISWSDVFERQLCMMKRALKRDTGPDARAKEVNPEHIPPELWEQKFQQAGVQNRPCWAYAWAVIWMLRCVELTQLLAGDITLNFNEETVTLFIRKSKMDQAAQGVKRTLKCCGQEICARLCPWSLGIRILAEHTEDDEMAPLFPDVNGVKVPKIKITKKWMDVIDPGMSGHSGRRSGAMWYARKGMPIYEIGTLGRWKSSTIFRYIEEALQDIPLNSCVTNSRPASKVDESAAPIEVPDLPRLPKTPGGEGAPVTPKVKVTKSKVNVPDQPWAVSTGRYGKISHRVRRASWNLGLSAWDTWCGWHFAERNVKVTLTPTYQQGTQKCKKCEQLTSPATKSVERSVLRNWCN